MPRIENDCQFRNSGLTSAPSSVRTPLAYLLCGSQRCTPEACVPASDLRYARSDKPWKVPDPVAAVRVLTFGFYRLVGTTIRSARIAPNSVTAVIRKGR